MLSAVENSAGCNPAGRTDCKSVFRLKEARLPEPAEPAVGEYVPGTIGGPAGRIHFAMRTDLHLRAAAFLQIPDQLFAGFELGARRLVAIEIADETNPQADVVHVIAVDMTAAHLFDPALADLDLAIAGRGAVADDELIGETVLHPADVAMIIIENARASLPGPAIVDDNEFPAIALDWG